MASDSRRPGRDLFERFPTVDFGPTVHEPPEVTRRNFQTLPGTFEKRSGRFGRPNGFSGRFRMMPASFINPADFRGVETRDFFRIELVEGGADNSLPAFSAPCASSGRPQRLPRLQKLEQPAVIVYRHTPFRESWISDVEFPLSIAQGQRNSGLVQFSFGTDFRPFGSPACGLTRLHRRNERVERGLGVAEEHPGVIFVEE